MRAVNSSSIFNPLEEQILAALPASAKHVLVVGAGDGRLARAMRGRLATDARVWAIEPRSKLRGYLDDLSLVGVNPWDLAACEAEVKSHGALDYIVFYGLHEYWAGQLRSFQRILEMAVPGCRVWVSFVNTSALRYLDHELPPLRLAADTLASPSRYWAKIDYATWISYITMLNCRVESVWGLLDHASFEFCQNPNASGAANWVLRDTKIQAGSAAEVIHWGAAYVGIQMTNMPEVTTAEAPQALGGAAFSPQLYQTLLDPYPEADSEEGELAWAETELRALRANSESLKASHLVEFVLGLVEKPETVKSVLVIGAGWGRDVYMINKARPQWQCVGLEPSTAMIATGAEFCRAAGVVVEPFTLGKKFPFADKSFDVVLTFGFLSKLYDQAVVAVLNEALRVAKQGIYHLEDGRGPEQSLRLKQNAVAALYGQFGHTAEPRPVLIKGQNSGFLFHKVVL